MQSFKEGDLVAITSYAGLTNGKYIGMTGPIKKIITPSDGLVYYFVDIGEPGFFFRDLICYEGEFKHAKEENNE